MSKVTITEEQAQFIEGFKKPWYFDNEEVVETGESLPMWASQALHNLMQFGFGYGLLDANDTEVSDDDFDTEDNFQHDQVPKLIEAIMNGYEVEKKEKTVALYMEFSESGFEGNRKLYYGAGINVINKQTATWYDLNLSYDAERVEKLKKQGWKVEEI